MKKQRGTILYVIAYITVVGYFLLAAISPQATVIPSTWPEFARVAVLLVLALAAYAWGQTTSRGLMILVKHEENHPNE